MGFLNENNNKVLSLLLLYWQADIGVGVWVFLLGHAHFLLQNATQTNG